MLEPSPESDLALGVDLGTSAIKVMVIDAAGAVAGEAHSSFETVSEAPRQAVQNPADWLTALSDAMRDLGASLTNRLGETWRRRLGAIALTGQLPTLVCLGECEPLARAITWRDGRADQFASERLGAAQRKRMYGRTGMPIDGRYLAPMLQFHFADRLDAVRCVLSAKDYFLFALTGVRATEPSTAAGYGLYDLSEQRFSSELAAFWGIALDKLPPILASNSIAAALSEAGARILQLPAGIPVTTGAADSVCASYAMSGLDPRLASISLGSSAVVISATSTAELDEKARFLVTPHVEAGWYGREMDLLATGTGYRWLCELFGWAEGELDQRAAASSAGAQGLYFAPYLAGGEQGALWNPKLRAGLFGLGLQHSQNDIARAFLEGVCFELRRCVEVLAENAPIDRVMVSGNITRSASSAQLLADILKRPVGLVTEKSPAAYGAALLARRALHRGAIGGASACGNATGNATGNGRDIAPAQSSPYDALYRDYCEVAGKCA
ncbi:MAG: FGGY family carbohydrate kinase [Gammaproteobacteria bacterium]